MSARRLVALVGSTTAAVVLTGCGALGSSPAPTPTPTAELTPIASQSPDPDAAAGSSSGGSGVGGDDGTDQSVSADSSRGTPDVRGTQFRDLAASVFTLDPPPGGFRRIDQFDGLLPRGTRVVSIDGPAQLICVEQRRHGIALDVDASNGGHLQMLEGTCEEGDRVARINAFERGRIRFRLTGDQDVGAQLLFFTRNNLIEL